MNVKNVVMAATLVTMLGLTGASTQASPLVYDSFDGTAGTLVTAHTPDIGGTWTTEGTLALTGAGTAASTSYGQATIGLAVDQTVQVGVLASFNMGAASWVGVTLSESSTPGWFFGANNHIWTRVNSNGTVDLGLSGWWKPNDAGVWGAVVNESWAGGTVANWDASKPHTIQLNVKANSFDAETLVDGVVVAGGNYGFANGWYHTDPRVLNSATFHVEGAGSFDYVAAGATPISIPEPASLGLVSLVGVGLCRRRR